MKTMLRLLTMTMLVLCAFEAQARADLVPQFNYAAPGWISPPLSIDMTPYWNDFGLPDQGTNYYSAGAPVGTSPFWERFDPKSPLYQGWFGVYVVNDFPCASEWSQPNLKPADIPCSIANVEDIISVDQFVWLAAYGDPTPVATFDASSVFVSNAPDGYFLLYGAISSDSDVGGTIPTFTWYPPYADESALVDAYAPVTLNAIARFKYIPDANELVVIYASGTEWTLLDGTKRATPPGVLAEQTAMVFATSFN